MTLQELDTIDFTGQSVLLIGRPGAGKTHIAKCLSWKYLSHELIHTDRYTQELQYPLPRAIYALFEDICHYKTTIVEGVLGYPLLLEGFKRKSYSPDIIIDVQISAGKQREVYLKTRDPKKLKYMEAFHRQHMNMLNEWHRLCPENEKPIFYTLNNEYATTD